MKVVCFDLDDTLFKEIDYLSSAYREIASSVTGGDQAAESAAYELMLATYKAGGNAFERLNKFLGIDRPVADYLDIYRNHRPDIRLSADVVETLDSLKSAGCVIGLITDGRSVQQRHKIEALGLGRWISEEDIVISEEFGSEKPDPANFEYFMKRYLCGEFVYVGDNPAKDFVAPNRLGWTTVLLKDDGRNVHKYDEEDKIDAQYQIDDIREVLTVCAV